MSDTMTTLLIVLGEATAFFMVVLVGIMIFRIRTGRTLKRSVKEFVKKIKNDGTEHRNKLKNILMAEHSLDETEADSAVENLIKHENSLYSKIIALYLGDKDSKLEDINSEVNNLTRVMHEATVNSNQNTNTIPELSVEEGENSNLLNSEIERLQQELDVVKEEKQEAQEKLQDAMNTMEGMMTEYASMYSGGAAAEGLDPEKDIKKVKDKIKELKGEENSTEQVKSEAIVDSDLASDAEDLDIDKEL